MTSRTRFVEQLDTTIRIRMPHRTKRRLNTLARELGRPKSELIDAWLDQHYTPDHPAPRIRTGARQDTIDALQHHAQHIATLRQQAAQHHPDPRGHTTTPPQPTQPPLPHTDRPTTR